MTQIVNQLIEFLQSIFTSYALIQVVNVAEMLNGEIKINMHAVCVYLNHESSYS